MLLLLAFSNLSFTRLPGSQQYQSEITTTHAIDMASAVAPWLQGLDEAWEVPAGVQIPSTAPISSATHAAGSLNNGSVRMPKHSQQSVRSRRSPLAPLNDGSTNSRRQTSNGPVGKLTESRSFSAASDGSMMQCGTVQQRSKSASPKKSQETLEWKRRLVRGQVGYGDQTDLFGPSGLDNIFAQSPQAEASSAPKARKGMSWLERNAPVSMPSSPPPWPKHVNVAQSERSEEDEGRLPMVGEGEEDVDAFDHERYAEEDTEDEVNDDGYQSNPFEEGSSRESDVSTRHLPAHQLSSPERFEPTPGHPVGNRTISGRTELEEDFSPVFISKHTTINGTVGYTALDSHTVKQFQEMNINLQHPDQEDSTYDEAAAAQETAEAQDMRKLSVEQSVFTDGDSIATVAPDLSLSENLPTGTPETAGFGSNVQVKRGGYSAEGSFHERPLSASPEREGSDFLSPMPTRTNTSGKPKRDRITPSTPHEEREMGEPRSRSSGSPLKLFGPHDTFTSNRLLRRLSQLDPDLSAIRSEADSEPREEDTKSHQTSTPAPRDLSFAQSFGSGSLNEHPFPAEITITGASDESGDALGSDLSPGSDVPPPGSKMPMLFKLESSPDAKNAFRVKRKASRQSTPCSKKTVVQTSRQSSSRKTSQPKAFLQATVEDASDMVSAFEAAAERVSERRSSSKHLFANASAGSSRNASQQPSSPQKPSSMPAMRGHTGNIRDTSEQPTLGKLSSIPIAVGKRPPNSPFKAPTPKRRRTLHASELQLDTTEARRSYREKEVENDENLKSDAADANRSYHEQLQEAISSQKRRSSREGDAQTTAEPTVLAQRKMLRPRNPTPSQRQGTMSGRVLSTRKEQIEAEIREATEAFAKQEPEAMEAVLEQMETSMASGSPPTIQQQARAVATEVAKFTLRVQKASAEHTTQERKRSVTTQDFFNEAVMVMRLIREKAGRQSGLGSVAESDQEGVSQSPSEEFDNSVLRDVSSPVLRVSRPPSRDGASGWRPRTSANTDARVISHLRRFQENDDTEFIAPSIASLRVGGDEFEDEEANYEDQDEDQYDEDDEQLVAVDEHSNIRIKGPLPARHNEDIDSRPSSQRSDHNTLHTQSTQSQSSAGGRSINTSCTKKSSDNVGNLAPDAVAHLIGEQVGGMVFDKDKQQWVRVRASPKKKKRGYGSFLEPPSDVTSSDDPFGEISDLPVDERKEEEIRRASAARSRAVSADNRTDLTKQMQRDVEIDEKRNAMQAQIESRTSSQETVVATRPSTRDSNKSRHTHSSSDPSRHTAFSSSQRQQETRATSWGDEQLQQLAKQGKDVMREQPLIYAAAQAALSLAQDQESIKTVMEPAQQTNAPPPLNPNDGTREMINEDSDVLAELQDDTELAGEDSDIVELASPKVRHTSASNKFKSHSTFRSNRQVSLRRKTLTSRFNDPDALEHSELSFVAALPGERMMSVNLSVSRPLAVRTPQGHVTKAASPSKTMDQSFLFSDLPDFTISEEDAERPSEQVLARRLAQHAADEVNDRFALAVKDIVRTLTDVYEEEPYWETIKDLDLRGKTVTTLHGLAEFCGSVRNLNVSKNQLAYMDGAPGTLRQLVARENQLSSLTCWTHLMNLQYLDISGNQLDNLDGLSVLYHLRELRADDNMITNVNGIADLDGLLKLRLRRNKINHVDFGMFQLQRLEELDLCGNRVETVHNLHELKSLRSLKLDGNRLGGGLQLGEVMPNLQYLSLRSCGLQRLDATNMPNLHTLLVDGNRLADVDHAEDLQSLDLLSMRNQSLPTGSEVSILSRPLAARAVRLSGTGLAALNFATSQLSIQQLEIASVGLQELPNDFGLKFSNLVNLNLNFNSLRDIRPLLNIRKLEVLSLAGNMVGRLRKSMATLSLLPTLKEVDMRDNPLTQGFYAPHTGCDEQSRIGSVVQKRPIDGEGAEDEDDEYERLTAANFRLPTLLSVDEIHFARLDSETTMRRRVYEILLSHCCPAVRILDGAALNRGRALERDEAWARLVELGVVKKCGKSSEKCRLGFEVKREAVGRITG